MVLISMEEWESYKETALMVKDKAALRSLIASFENRDKGISSGKPFEEVFSDML